MVGFNTSKAFLASKFHVKHPLFSNLVSGLAL